jgi:succinylglutamate desuccinylase
MGFKEINIMLTELNHVPEGFENCSANNLHTILTGPTLIHLEGRRKQPLFVSVLLHGNEPTGLFALQLFLKKNHGKALPRSISIFIGNVTAAREDARHLHKQPDYNRIWPCGSLCQQDDLKTHNKNDTPERVMMKYIIDVMREKNVFASIDVHNNTGLNPHYGCINKLDHRFFHLATLFSRTVVYFIRPTGVHSMAFADICPAVTVECGKPDQPYGATHAAEYINTCLHLSDLPSHQVAAHDMNLFHTVATITVPEHISFSFSDEISENKNIKKNQSIVSISTDICFPTTLDHLNFTELSAGTTLGNLNTGKTEIPLRVTDEHGKDATTRYLTLEDGELRTTREFMPSMFTLDKEVIRQDCLGYLMERMDW